MQAKFQSSRAYGERPSWQEVADRAIELLETPESRLLLGYWRDSGSAERPPGRRDLDPSGFASALSHVWLMDYLPGERRLRYRLAGEEISNRYEGALTGKCLDEVVGADAYARVAPHFLVCPERPAIAMMLGRVYQECQKPGQGERLLLPLVDSEGAPEGLIGITLCRRFFADRAEAERMTKRRVVVLPLDGSEASDRTD